MTTQAISTAINRIRKILERRPEAGLHDDSPATARWQGGLRVVSSHANGTQMLTDMPSELGGTGDQVTPGWLFRAGLASCLATSIAIRAASEGIELLRLEVLASSRSDTRGFLGMSDAVGGEPVCAGPQEVQLCVRISAPGIASDRLSTLVEESHRCSPVPNAIRNAAPVDLRIKIDAA
jgi:organic hydroperoxide reductase OsmC/OhrA